MHTRWNVPGVWLAFALASLGSVPGSAARADSASLAPPVLKKVKEATVHLEIGLPNGTTVEGSGFFTDEPGVIMTNAHVLGMLDADSRPPVKIAVNLNSGEASARTIPGKFVGVDRGSDLALVRVEGKDLPAPLTVVPATDLTETADVFIFGFPLGKRLGKNITVARSSVSSLRKQGGVLKEIQVNGGMHPGNSGGPVVNGKGEVVGVAVSVIQGTQLHFAIPGETVQGFLQGKVVSMAADLGYKAGDSIKMPFRLVVVDPLGRLKKISVDTWVGPPGTRRRPGGPTEPPAQPGDSDRQTVAVPYEKQPVTSVELTLPPLEGAGKAYWMRPSYVNGEGKQVWFGSWAPSLSSPVERRDVSVRYQPKLGNTQLTEVTSEGSFRLRYGLEDHSLAVNLKGLLRERSAPARERDVLPIHVDYRTFSLSVLEDGKVVPGDAELKRDLKNFAGVSNDLEMEADGSVGRANADLAKVPRASREGLTPLNEQVLQTLELVAVPLPQGAMKPLQSWKVQRPFLLGSTLLGVRAQADIKYTYLGTRLLGKREIAMLNVSGNVRGLRNAGLSVAGKIEGGSQIALDTGEVLSAELKFKAEADLEMRREHARLFGNLTVRVRRDVPPPAPPAPKTPKNN